MNNDPRTMSFIYVINEINSELRRLNTRVKELRELRKKQERSLYSAMKALNVESSGGYTKKSLESKYGTLTENTSDKIRRTKKIKTTEALELFRQTGIPDPEGFLKNYKATQRTFE